MTRDEVMSMTDGQLQAKAAELMGWERIEPVMEYHPGVPGRDVEVRWIGPGGEREYLPPDYLDNIAAAWELIDVLADRGDRHIMVRFDSLRVGYPNNPNWTIHVTPDIRMDVGREAVPRAITRAFILAMEEE